MSTAQDSTRLERLRTMLRHDAANEGLWRRCAELTADGGDFEGLLELVRLRRTVAADDADVLFHESTALIGLKRYKAAAETLEALLKALPDHPAALRNLGLCHYALREFDRAEPYLRRCYDAGDRTPDLVRLLASACHHLGLLDEGIEVARANLPAAAENAATAGVFALLFLDADDPVHAARCAADALRRDPQSIDGAVVAGTLALARLETGLATRYFAGVVERAPDNGRAWVGLGTVALLEHDFERARAALQRGVTHMPGHVGSWHVLAWTELVAGRIDEAARLFSHAAELDRNFSESHGGLASVAALRGDRASALREIEIAKRLDPQCLSAKFAESVLLDKSGDAAKAQELIAATVTELASGKGGGALKKLLSSSGRAAR